jgi:hypothetical protein
MSRPNLTICPFFFLDADRRSHPVAKIAFSLGNCQSDCTIQIIGKYVGGFAFAFNIPALIMGHDAIVSFA